MLFASSFFGGIDLATNGRRRKGSGSITKDLSHKKIYKASYPLGYGKKKVKRFDTEKEAKNWLRAFDTNNQAKASLLSKGVSFSAYADKYLEVAQKEYAKKPGYESEKWQAFQTVDKPGFENRFQAIFRPGFLSVIKMFTKIEKREERCPVSGLSSPYICFERFL